MRHDGIDINQVGKAVRKAVGHARDHHAAIAVPDQDSVAQFFRFNRVDHVRDMRLQRDTLRQKMRTFAHPCERNGKRAVTRRPKGRQHTLPTPGAVPGTMDQDEIGHYSLR